MDYFLSNLMIALGVATTPAPAPIWTPYAASEYFLVEVDLSSIKVRGGVGDWEVSSNVKFTPASEIAIKGKKKKGAYFIHSVTAKCKEDKLIIDEVTLFAKDGTALTRQQNPGELTNPGVDGNFVTEYLKVTCDGPVTTPQKPGITI